MTSTTMLRFDALGVEYRCRGCDEFWPITPEFWRFQANGYVRTDRCVECHREKGRLAAALRRLDAEYRERNKRYSRNYRIWLKKHEPTLVDAYDRELRERDAARVARWRADQAA